METQNKKKQFGKVVTIAIKGKSCSCKGDKGCSCDNMCKDCTSQKPKRMGK